ncbi:hypothetical protein CIPAW_04G100100 [Carya illinoinensis]|uniref:Uncharacterized protein n=1 Tax=Carya illinoinensis TaxID=32201 RepID=A0A8T1QSW9_CARIL|nr:hypothetical protein CIPAW_04G100100 [Carya illinoinensis]
MILYLATPRACPSMNHHMSFRRRKKGSSNVKMKRQRSDRSCSTLSSMPVCLPFNSILGKLILLIGMGLIIPSTMHSLPCLLGLVITNMEGPVALLEVQIGTLQVQIRVEGITKTVGPKLEATVVGHIHRKDEDHLMVGVACLPPVKEELRAVMELARQIIPKLVNLEVQLVVEVQTRWVAIEINSMVGSNNSREEI